MNKVLFPNSKDFKNVKEIKDHIESIISDGYKYIGISYQDEIVGSSDDLKTLTRIYPNAVPCEDIQNNKGIIRVFKLYRNTPKQANFTPDDFYKEILFYLYDCTFKSKLLD